ncbi:MAG: TonB-dependent receptor [Ignavibacteria bacterium]|nr:TonB-dependent receptor [Ignavibacteria bacterium]
MKIAIVTFFIFLLLDCSTATAYYADSAEVGTLSGLVVDKANKARIPGVTIRIQNTTIGAITNSAGKFNIKGVPLGVVILRVTSIGYTERIIPDVVISSGKPSQIVVELEESTLESNGTVVTANAFQRETESITSTTYFTAEEVRRAPGVQEDVIRAIALVPGVAVTTAGRNDLAVRGGAPFENLFIVDNIEIPNINHFGSQGSSGGPLSLINVALVNGVSVSTGGFGPKFGDRLSSVTNLTLKDGNSVRIAGEINLSATGFGVMADGPIGKSTTFFASVRRSYLDFIFSLAGLGFIPEYWDFNTKVTHEVDDFNKISFVGIGALDKVKFNNTAENLYKNSRVVAPSQNQYFTGITWRHLFSAGYSNVTFGRWYSDFSTIQQDSLGTNIFQTNSAEGENSLRADIVLNLSSNVELTGGLIGKFASTLKYDVIIPGYARLNSVGVPSPLTIDTSFTATKAAVYTQITFRALEFLKLTAGGRLDYFSFVNQSTNFSPRFSALLELSSNTNFTVSAGRYFQAPQYIWLVGSKANAAALKPLSADQIVGSLEWIAMPDLRIQVEGYYKSYANYPVRQFRPQAVLSPFGFDDVYSDIPFGLEPLSSTGTGNSYGIEFFIQKKLSQNSPFYGLISLTLNRTQFVASDSINRLGAFDTPFISTTAIGWRPNGEWEFSTKFRASEGLTYTPFITNEQRANETGFPVGSRDFSLYNQGGRLPFFYALDIRIDKRWFLSGVQIITYIDIQNLTGRKNVSGYQWNQQTLSIRTQESIGILPSIGINVAF